jgi:hypothetical protein
MLNHVSDAAYAQGPLGLGPRRRALTGRQFFRNGGVLYLDDNRFNRDVNHVKSASKIVIERDWLVSEGENMLWLPPDAEPGCSTV